MTGDQLQLRNVTWFFPGHVDPVIDRLDAFFPEGFTGIIGPNGCGKTTLLRLVAGQLEPTEGEITGRARTVLCPQRPEERPEDLAALLEAPGTSARRLAAVLGVEPDWPDRWRKLSDGERKRAQIAVALWRKPRVLLLDEPTNHIDADARRMLVTALGDFRGIGLLVSHDRELLDALCDRCLFFEPGGVRTRPGGYSKAVALAEADRQRDFAAAERAAKEVKKREREVRRHREEASRADRKRSKRGLARKDHDARSRMDAARLAGKDATAGGLLKGARSQLERARADLDAARREKRRRLNLVLTGTRCQRSFLYRAPATTLSLGPDRQLSLPELEITPDDRIALTGPNGAGKTSIVRHILSRLDLPAGRVVSLPQEIGREESGRILREVRDLDRKALGKLLTVVGSLGSDPERLLRTPVPSPGELRKLLLARGLANDPWLLVMDEPTNHLDLPSIECLEDALSESPAALLLVSHDETFLSHLANRSWRIENGCVLTQARTERRRP